MRLVFSDEFEGTALDSSKWTADLGGGGWGNAEEQVYTDDESNLAVRDGHLVIAARMSASTSPSKRAFTSGRIKTKGIFEFKHGTVQMRAKLPYGGGIWSAFWALGANIDEVGWPACGEIDIMELFGTRNNRSVWSTVHTSARSHVRGGAIRGGGLSLPALDREFHTWQLQWRSHELLVSVDGEDVFHYERPASSDAANWPFDQPHFLLLNLAVGGGPVGAIDERRFAAGPVEFLVDWVRVYQVDGMYEDSTVPSPPPVDLSQTASSLSDSDQYWYNSPVWLGVASVGGLVVALLLLSCLRSLCRLLWFGASPEPSVASSCSSPGKAAARAKSGNEEENSTIGVPVPVGAVVEESTVKGPALQGITAVDEQTRKARASICDQINSLRERSAGYETLAVPV